MKDHPLHKSHQRKNLSQQDAVSLMGVAEKKDSWRNGKCASTPEWVCLTVFKIFQIFYIS